MRGAATLVATTGLTTNAAPAIPASSKMSETPKIEQFKSFMSNPPVLVDLVFCKFTPTGLYLPQDFNNTSTECTATYYRVRWQPMSLSIEVRTNINFGWPYRPAGEEVSIRNNDSYVMVERTGFTFTWQKHVGKREDVDTSPARAFHHSSEEFNEVVSMGLLDLEPGSVKWIGDNFYATGYHYEEQLPVRVSGILRTNADGYPDNIEAEYVVAARQHHYIAKYAYESHLGVSFIPSTISLFIKDADKCSKLMEWKILRIETGESNASAADFNITALLAESKLKVHIFTNNTMYGRNSLGYIAPIGGSFKRMYGPHGSGQGTFIYFSLVTICAIGLVVMVRKANKTKTN